MAQMPQLMQITADQEKKIAKKNLLVNAMGTEGQQIVVVGDTSTGKSTTINFLLGYPINFEAAGIGTRRPCVIAQEMDPSAEEVVYKIYFPKPKNPFNEVTSEMSRVVQCVTAANDPNQHPYYFKQLEDDPSIRKFDGIFDFQPIFITMKHKDFKTGLRLIDLPGLVRGHDTPLELAKTYIKPGNVVILVLGVNTPANCAFPELAANMVQAEEVLFVQNFATEAITDGKAEQNFRALKDKYEEIGLKDKRATDILSTLKFYMLDVGVPKTDKFVENGRWKAGIGQENWTELADTAGADEVQQAMRGHAEKQALRLRTDYPSFFNGPEFSNGFGAGVIEILNKVITFSFDSIDTKIQDYRKRCQEMLDEEKAKYDALVDKCKDLDHPKEWEEVLNKAALTVSEFLDTTIAIPTDDADGSLRDVVTCLKTVDQEINLPDDFEAKTELEFGQHRKNWFNDTVDKQVYETIKVHAYFEKDNELACLRSWFRVLDELVAFLAFLPMPFIKNSAKLQRQANIDSSKASDRTNMIQAMVELVAATDGKITNGRFTAGIRSLILQFARRIIRLAQRDLKNGVSMFRQDKHFAITKFLELMGDNTEDARKTLCDKIEDIILTHMVETFTTTIAGSWEYDENGEIVKKFGEARKKAQSGICVIDPGTSYLWWLLPFKGHYFNGQIPWADLRLSADFDCENKKDLKQAIPSGEDPLLDTEISDGVCLNASSCINLKMYQLATEMYDIDMGIRDPAILYSAEVMKLLKAMQGEVASFWNSSKIRMLQITKDQAAITSYFTNELKEELKANGMVIELQNFEDWSKPFLDKEEAIESIVLSLGDNTRGEEFGKTTKQEIEEAASELARRDRELARSLPTEELAWPGLTNQQYMSLLDTEVKEQASHRDAFPASSAYAYYGDISYRRLCDEFAYVILQLSMKEVSDSELAMAKASRGAQIVESPQEIITKLVCHRLQSIGQSSTIIFKYRFLFIYMRVIAEGTKDFMEKKRKSKPLPKVGDMDGHEWIKKKFSDYCEKVLDDMRGKIAEKFDELTPFDWTTLNGRFPFGRPGPICPSMFFKRKFAGGREVVEKETDVQAKKTVHEMYDQPLRQQWLGPNAAGDPNDPDKSGEPKFLVEKDTENAGRITLDESTNKVCFETLDDSRVDMEIQFAMEDKSGQAPGNPEDKWAGGVFHEMALRVHKSMVASAIDFCKPKLKNMMSQVYKEESLRECLQRSPKLKYKDMYGELVRKIRQECGEADARRKELQETLDILDDKVSATPTAENMAAIAAAQQRKAAQQQAKAAEMAAQKKRLEEEAASATTNIAELESMNAKHKAELKRYVANELLSSWSLSIHELELSKLPSPGEDSQIVIQGFYFQAPGWNGRDIKKVTPPKTSEVFPYQWLFCTDPKPMEPGKNMTWSVDDFYGKTMSGLSGLNIPALFPVQEHFVAIEVKAYIAGKKSGFFGKTSEAEEKSLFTVCIPLAYALMDKTNEFQNLESVGAYGPMHRAPQYGGAFRIEDRGSKGGNEKKYKFIYEEDMKHYGMEVPEARGAKVEILISQNQLRQLTAKAAAPKETFAVSDKVLYYSSNRKQWFPCDVIAVNPDGTYKVSLKPTENIEPKYIKKP